MTNMIEVAVYRTIDGITGHIYKSCPSYRAIKDSNRQLLRVDLDAQTLRPDNPPSKYFAVCLKCKAKYEQGHPIVE